MKAVQTIMGSLTLHRRGQRIVDAKHHFELSLNSNDGYDVSDKARGHSEAVLVGARKWINLGEPMTQVRWLCLLRLCCRRVHHAVTGF